MATKQSTVDFLLDQLIGSNLPIRTRKMFGEYALYVGEKVTGFICDDTLFIKITTAGKAFIQSPIYGQAYPGSKDYFIIDQDMWEQREWITELLSITAAVLPLPKKKTT